MKKKLTIVLAIFILGTVLSCDVSGSDSNNTENPLLPAPLVDYTVTFHSNNGLNETTSVNVTETISYMLAANTFSNPGHGFIGWSLSVDGTTADYTNMETIKMPSKNINLYAIWALGDTLNPAIVDVEMFTGDINTTLEEQIVTFKITANDDIKLKYVECTLINPEGRSHSSSMYITDNNYIGNETAGVFTLNFTIDNPSFGYPAGIWYLKKVRVTDDLNKSQIIDVTSPDQLHRGWDYSFNNVNQDTENPQILNIEMLTPGTIDASLSDQTVTYKITASDDVQLDNIRIYIQDPLGDEEHGSANIYMPQDYIGNTNKEGYFLVDVTIPMLAPLGEWNIKKVVLYDLSFKETIYNNAELETKGWNYKFNTVGVADTANPVINNFVMTTGDLNNPTIPNQTAKFKLTATDDFELGYVQVYIENEAASANRNGSISFTGSNTNREYIVDFIFSSGIDPSGTWKVTYIRLTDTSGKDHVITEYNNPNHPWLYSFNVTL